MRRRARDFTPPERWRGAKQNPLSCGPPKLLLTIVVKTTILTFAMRRQLQTEILQQKPFESLEQEALLNILRTADVLIQRLTAVLKPFKLSHSQYNVLRILRGAGADGLACQEIGERMISRDPDITRLLDRLEARGLVTRTRDQKDRRVVTARITSEGLRILAQLDGPVAQVDRRQLEHLGERQLRSLIQLLEVAREPGR
jgi:DNA-binding MarR family transcriptional regulator